MTRPFLLCLTLAVAATAPGSAAARDFAPVDRPGPPLTPSAAQLRSTVSCDDNAATSARAPVLLTSGTTVPEHQNFGWNHVPALRAAGFPVCLVDAPGERAYNNEDIQERAEYVVHAIRFAFATGGRRPIAIVGHSQGGQVMRWALRFWPDTRPMVTDVVGIAATNHGSAVVPALCVSACAPALWQQRDTSDYVRALNSGQETFAPISYTNVYTRTDQFVQPNLDDSGTTSLHTGDGRIANVASQDVCPGNTADHLQIGTFDPVGWAFTLDALTHDGPADPARIDTGVCNQTFMPGVDQSTFAADFGEAASVVATQLATARRVAAEPPLKDYVYADAVIPAAPGTATATGTPKPAAPACARKVRRVRVPGAVVRVRQGSRTLRLRRHTVTVRFGGRQRSVRLRLVLRGGRLRTLVVARCPATR